MKAMQWNFCLFLLFIACKCPAPAAASKNSQEPARPPLTHVLSENYGGSEEESLQIIRSQAGLKKFFAKVNQTRKPGIPLPKVNFEEQTVLVYCPGRTQNGESSGLEVTQMREDKILVQPVLKNRQDKSTATAVTLPFELYTMPRTDMEIELQKRGTP